MVRKRGCGAAVSATNVDSACMELPANKVTECGFVVVSGNIFAQYRPQNVSSIGTFFILIDAKDLNSIDSEMHQDMVHNSRLSNKRMGEVWRASPPLSAQNGTKSVSEVVPI